VSALELRAVWSPALKNVSALFGPGLHVVVGQDSDGADDLIALCAGVRVPRRGQLLLDGRPPSASPSARRRIASLLPSENPDRRSSVRAWLNEVGQLHGFDAGRSHAELLPDVKLERAVASLSGVELRRLALALALGQPEPLLVALHDPLAAAQGDASDAVLQRILELARQAIVIVTTPSLLDARRLGGGVHVLDRGVLARQAAHAWPGAVTPGLDVWLAVDCDSPRELLAELCKSPDVEQTSYDARRAPRRLQLRGPDLARLAIAVSRAAVAARVEIQLLQVAAEDLDSVRGATAGLANAAYRAVQDARRPGEAGGEGNSGAASGGAGGNSKAAT
jgi:ABC-type thiamine transport system ATPase subunit